MYLTQNSEFLVGRYKLYFDDGFWKIGDIIYYRSYTSDGPPFKFKILDGPVFTKGGYKYILEPLFIVQHFPKLYRHFPKFMQGDVFTGVEIGPLRVGYKNKIYKTGGLVVTDQTRTVSIVKTDPYLEDSCADITCELEMDEKGSVLATQYDLADLVPNNSELNDIDPPKSLISRIKRFLK